MDAFLYDVLMAKSRQIAFQIDDEALEAIDALTPSEFSSRAEVIRVAIRDWLGRRRAEAVDEALAKGYGLNPPSGPEEVWADRSLEGLDAAHLDW